VWFGCLIQVQALRRSRFLSAHTAMLEGIRSGDPDRAEAATRAHLQDIARRAARTAPRADETHDDRRQGGTGRRRTA
jgi:FCD domain.